MRCVEREKLSPAESSFEGSGCEVPPGVDSVKGWVMGVADEWK